jgi:NAD(P)-dependent dehydrogenase (short-subunit alcohol dehydrogenase family)
MIDFEDQVVIVTGAGRGMGRLFALDFARRGAAVVVNDLGGATAGGGADSSVANAVVEEIKSAGGKAVASVDSVVTPEGGAAIVQKALDAFGRVDALVSNAGIVNKHPFEDLTVEQWRTMLGVHMDGAFNVSQPAYRVMQKQRYGRFVFMSSSAGVLGAQGEAHYAAAKSGIVGLKNVIALEGEPYGIKANAVLPWATTRMITDSFGDQPQLRELPLLKIMQPDLVVPLVVYLASKSCEVTKHNYSGAAGRYARVFTAVGPGWDAGAGASPTADDLAANLAQASALEPYYVPTSVIEESAEICERRDIVFKIPGSEN